MWDFNLTENFNQAALAKLLIAVFPINGTRFFLATCMLFWTSIWHNVQGSSTAPTTVWSASPATPSIRDPRKNSSARVSIGDIVSTTTRISTVWICTSSPSHCCRSLRGPCSPKSIPCSGPYSSFILRSGLLILLLLNGSKCPEFRFHPLLF